jgi:lipopolysaccharide/colanic/teichoic acid biosynthesis glycosyltransferase
MIALSVLVVALPMMLLIAAIIRLDSSGPALFFQSRLGRHAQPFWFVKFRTMYVDARQRYPELYAYRYNECELEALRFKVQDDPRVTRFGRWLRTTSLDELPNFWNVLTCDMSLVGPRPDIPEMLPYYRGEEHLKFQVRPGITGFAQTCGRGDLTFRETLALDVAYVRVRSAILDIKVLWRTIRMVIVGHGAF